MRSSFRRAMLNSPDCQLHGGGARRHPHPITDVTHAGRQAPAQLSATGKKTGSTHTNRSPINPVHFRPLDQPLDPRHGELWHLRDSGLVQTVRFDRDHTVVTLTKEGRDLLESRRLDDDSRERQAFYAGVPKPRELKHDAELCRAYTEEAERLRDEGANIHRIVLENDLKREYQEFLQERNRDRDDSDGRPDRDPLEIQDWARKHELPCDDRGHVQFPDVRIEYDIDGRDHTLDVEVMTPHYRGAHGAAKSGSGFRLYFTAHAGRGRSGGRTPSVIEELL